MKKICQYSFWARQTKTRTDAVKTALRCGILAILAGGICLCLQKQAEARPGDLDTTFGTNGTGKVVVPLPTAYYAPDDPTGIVVQHNGKIVVADRGQDMVRLNPDGTVDKNFPARQITYSTQTECARLILDPRDRLLQLGGKSFTVSDENHFWMRRFSPDGVLDTSFGSAGEVAVEMGEFAIAYDAVVQPDGKIVMAGFSQIGMKRYFGVVRVTSDGVPDPTFGTGGHLITDLGGYHDWANAVVLQPDGKIVVVGYSNTDSPSERFAVVRYTTTGDLDPTFNGNGKVTVSFGRGSDAFAGALQRDGKIVAGGWVNYQMAVARFNSDGTIDKTFGANNGLVLHREGAWDSWNKVIVQPDGKILTCGNSANSAQLFVGRYLKNGSPDPAFGQSSTSNHVGIAPVQTGPQMSLVIAMALLPNGKLLTGGLAYRTNGLNTFADLVVARLENDGVAFPAITCPEPIVGNCGDSATLTAAISDPSGQPLTAIWNVNGTSVQTNSLTGADSGTNFVVTLAHAYATGTNEVRLTVTDSLTNSTSCSTLVTIIDRSPPVISSANLKPSVLWPPNHKLVPVNVSATATDNCDDSTTWKIVQVSSNQESNEPVPDWIITGDHSVLLRAERSDGAERVYTITIQATDSSANVSEPRNLSVSVSAGSGAGGEQVIFH
jgi:uncharacterized delta-60 repeat protein